MRSRGPFIKDVINQGGCSYLISVYIEIDDEGGRGSKISKKNDDGFYERPLEPIKIYSKECKLGAKP